MIWCLLLDPIVIISIWIIDYTLPNELDTNMLLKVQWNITTTHKSVDYFISITPPTEFGSVFTTSNTTIQLPVFYNQEYNISVMANNCAGNSTPASANFYIGK